MLRLFLHPLHPFLVVQIPLDSFADAGFEGVRWSPAEFALNLAGVDGVAAIVTRAVFDVCDQLARFASEMRGELVHQIANQFNDADVRPFIVTPDVVGFAELAAREHLPERFSVVAHVKPVADVHAIAINGDGFACANAFDDHRNQFFGKLKWPVIVRAIGRHDWQAVRVVIRAHEQIARCFACGIGRVRRVRCFFREKTGRAKATVNFVR
ncbi:MAG: hypothetical protein JWO95_1455 [Verrucomicrobiales bacterium]|nr:hypothetical protein [Verrucomicrobiales bacterium]